MAKWGNENMRFATFHLMTRPDGATSQQIVVETLAEAELAEELGFDRVWLTEHHASDHGICSAPSVFAAALAARTTRIGIGYAGSRARSDRNAVAAAQ
ncbi:MAG TPA: LLM class flavin-dependent oxidoreductase [Candidatus Latescibacteria bacterium]|nr:LLM class flavin-dependent oxidoreductase [Candidatus Handelsmanbacteria bacterium]HIL10264.1 LLM class flavin-dependent oxidoreductase [Candidatus Latescibacterota bacterium]